MLTLITAAGLYVLSAIGCWIWFAFWFTRTPLWRSPYLWVIVPAVVIHSYALWLGNLEEATLIGLLSYSLCLGLVVFHEVVGESCIDHFWPPPPPPRLRPHPYERLRGKSVPYLLRAQRIARNPDLQVIILEYLISYQDRHHLRVVTT